MHGTLRRVMPTHVEGAPTQLPTADEGWLTLAQAAQQLGCSIDTVRRKLKRGELEHRQRPSPHGPTWYMRLPAAQGRPGQADDVAPGHAADAAQAAAMPIGGLVELLEHTQTELVRTATAGAMWQTRAELLAIQLQQAQERILALEAPKEQTSTDRPLGSDSDAVDVQVAQTTSRDQTPPVVAPRLVSRA